MSKKSFAILAFWLALIAIGLWPVLSSLLKPMLTTNTPPQELRATPKSIGANPARVAEAMPTGAPTVTAEAQPDISKTNQADGDGDNEHSDYIASGAGARPKPIPKPDRSTTAPVVWASDIDQKTANDQWRAATDALAADPTHPVALRDALRVGQDLGKWDELATLLAKTIAADPDATDWRFERAVILMRIGRWVDASAELRAVVERRPDDGAAWHNLAICDQALGRLSAALANWTRTIELMPNNADALAHRSETLLDLREPEAAAKDIRAALTIEPNRVDCLLNLSLALDSLGQLTDALREVEIGLAAHPDNPALLTEAARIIQKICATNPPDDRALRNRALEYCRRALKVQPTAGVAKRLLQELDQAQ